MLTSFGPFWEDFGAVWEPFGSPKVRKRGPKSIPKINWIFMSIFIDFWMVWEFKHDSFALNSLGGTRFLERCVFGSNFDRKSLIFGPQNGPKSELWGDNSGPQIDKNFSEFWVGKKMVQNRNKGVQNRNFHRWGVYFWIPGASEMDISKDQTIQNRHWLSHNASGLKPGEFNLHV